MEREHQRISDLFRRVSNPDVERGFVLSELIRELTGHLSVEHSLVMPVVQRRLSAGRELSEKLKSDYSEMLRLLVKIERRKPNSPDQPDLVSGLEDAFARHRRIFSNDLRPGLESDLSDGDRAELLRKITSARSLIVSHPHPHLLSLGPLSRFTTRIAAGYDRLRDRLSGRPARLS